MRRTVATAALCALVLAGCAGTDETTDAAETPATSDSPSLPPSEAPPESPSESPSEQPTDDADDADDTDIEIEIEGDGIEPNGKRVPVAVGEEIVLDIETDRAAELHVHSSPEQVLEVPRGESRLTLTIDKPGVVDVEEHDTGIVILRLEVR